MNQQQIEQEIALAERKLHRLRTMTPDPPDRCFVCGVTENEGYLSDVTVTTCEGEEGYSRVTMWLCEDHIDRVVSEVQLLGFRHHHHGSTDLLEDDSCRASGVEGQEYGPCPAPDEDAEVTLKWPGA